MVRKNEKQVMKEENTLSEIDKVPVIQVPKQVPKIKVLAAIPACNLDHVQYREQVVSAVQVSIAATDNTDVTLMVCEEADNLVSEQNSWNSVVEKFNAFADRVLTKTLIVSGSLRPMWLCPKTRSSHLLSDDADWRRSGALPLPKLPVMLAGGEIYRDLACTGYFLPDKQGKPTFDIHNLYIKDVKDKVLVGSPEHMIFNGTGCILIKRACSSQAYVGVGITRSAVSTCISGRTRNARVQMRHGWLRDLPAPRKINELAVEYVA